MEIKIGESLFLGDNSDYKLSPPVSGLASPAFRVGDGVYAGRDGGYVSGHYYGHRTLVLRGFYIGTDCENAAELRRVLFGYLRIRYRLPILITTAEGQYYTEGVITDVKADVTNLKGGEYQLTILCPDPILYEAALGVAKWYEHTLVNGGTTEIANGGDVEIYPVITITGIVDGVELTNDTTEQTMQIDVTSENDDDEIVVDMQKRIITLNGVGINEDRSLNSSWWYLAQEANDITVNIGEDSGSSVEVKIRYRKGFSGV